jgi:glyoxylase-like metal-dependent hydrolase (beta-lactamase superfamily II)
MATELAEGVHSIGRDHIEMYAVQESGRLTLVDTGFKSDWKHLNEELHELGKGLEHIEAVVLTHAHVDHMGNAERVRQAGAKLHLHNHEVSLAAKPGDMSKRDPKARSMLSYGLPLLFATFRFAPKMMGGQPTPVTNAETFSDGDVLDVPGKPRCIHVPGHTEGSAAFYIASRDVIFTGDALVSYNFLSGHKGPAISASPSNWSSQAAIESLENLKGMQVSTVLPGHGAPMIGLEEAVEAALRHGSDAKP